VNASSRQAARRELDTIWLLTVAADRYAKELEELPMQWPEFGDVALQRFACLLQFVSLDRFEYV